jgi:Mrp family chromosome partitioning ATPase
MLAVLLSRKGYKVGILDAILLTIYPKMFGITRKARGNELVSFLKLQRTILK